MGLDVYLKADSLKDRWPEDVEDLSRVEPFDVPSDKHPDHMFKKTYLRSSYNPGGFNTVVRNLTGDDLWTIFDVTEVAINDEGEFRPDWEGARRRAIRVTGTLRKEIESGRGLTVETVTAIPMRGKQDVSSEEAIQRVREEMDEKTERAFKSYSNWKGDFFFGNPLTLVAAIPGVDPLGAPAVHLVQKEDLDWYVQAAEIVVEMCEFALTLENPRLIWSH